MRRGSGGGLPSGDSGCDGGRSCASAGASDAWSSGCVGAGSSAGIRTGTAAAQLKQCCVEVRSACGCAGLWDIPGIAVLWPVAGQQARTCCAAAQRKSQAEAQSETDVSSKLRRRAIARWKGWCMRVKFQCRRVRCGGRRRAAGGAEENAFSPRDRWKSIPRARKRFLPRGAIEISTL